MSYYSSIIQMRSFLQYTVSVIMGTLTIVVVVVFRYSLPIKSQSIELTGEFDY